VNVIFCFFGSISIAVIFIENRLPVGHDIYDSASSPTGTECRFSCLLSFISFFMQMFELAAIKLNFHTCLNLNTFALIS